MADTPEPTEAHGMPDPATSVEGEAAHIMSAYSRAATWLSAHPPAHRVAELASADGSEVEHGSTLGAPELLIRTNKLHEPPLDQCALRATSRPQVKGRARERFTQA